MKQQNKAQTNQNEAKKSQKKKKRERNGIKSDKRIQQN